MLWCFFISANEEGVAAAEKVVKAAGLASFDFRTFENPVLQRYRASRTALFMCLRFRTFKNPVLQI